MSQNKKCYLCGSSSSIRKSHIIPRFVINYLKKTSATGYLRGVINPNLRKQDIKRFPILCSDCEVLFSKYEGLFANNVFYPYHDKNKTSFNYREELKKFAVSLSWRILAENLFQNKRRGIEFIKAELNWRDYLNNKTKNTKPYQHHIFFGDYSENITVDDFPEKLQWYLGRGIDGTIVSSKKGRLFVYTKLCKIMIISFINPPKDSSWISTEIKNSGLITASQIIKDGNFGNFILDRARVVTNAMNSISKQQDKKIEKDFLKDPLRVQKSLSLKAFLEEQRLKKERNES